MSIVNGELRKGRAPKKHYTRRCRRCLELYKTPHKYSRNCKGCHIPTGGWNREYPKGMNKPIIFESELKRVIG